MDSVLRSVTVYFLLLLILRGSGKRSLAQITTFDFVLVLILGEAAQQSLVGNDFSVTTGLIVIASLVGIDVTLSFLKERFPSLDRWMDGLPLVILEDGEAPAGSHGEIAHRRDRHPRRRPRAARAGASRPDQVRRARAQRRDLDRSEMRAPRGGELTIP